MDRNIKVFECLCYDENHLMVVTRWLEEEDEGDWASIDFSIQAHYHTGFWGRIWQGMKYVWNPEDGCFWSGTALTRESVKELIEELNDFYNGVKPNGKK